MNEPSVVLKDLLYANWGLTSPARDPASKETLNPVMVHFTNRRRATNPRRIHSYQISVLAGDKKNIPEEVGSLVTYRIEELVTIELWAVVGLGQEYLTVEQQMRNMIDQLDLTIRLSATVATGIQFVRLSPGGISSDLPNGSLLFHREYNVTAVYYRTENALIPPLGFPLWDTLPWLWDDGVAAWS